MITSVTALLFATLLGQVTISLEAESGSGQGTLIDRSNASSKKVAYIRPPGTTWSVPFHTDQPGNFTLDWCRFSNDHLDGSPLEQIQIYVDSVLILTFFAADTGNWTAGWNVFVESPRSRTVQLGSGEHVLRTVVTGGDGYGVDLDLYNCTLIPIRTTPGLIVIDDDSAQSLGGWRVTNGVKGYYGTGYRWVVSDGRSKLTYRTNIPTAGMYNVYARWTAHPNRNPAAPYSIVHARGTTLVRRSQKTLGGVPVLLGTFRFDASRGASVTLVAAGSGVTIGDAVYFEWAGP